MDKYEYQLKTEHIKQVAARKEYEEAAKLCHTIDWTKIRDVKMLTLVADIYTAVGEYNDAIDILQQAYQYAAMGRRIVYRLTELALKADSYEDAKNYFEEFCRIAPNDQGRYILLYKMARSQKATLEEKIKILEAYKREDFDEKWAYELAVLYAMNGQKDKCVQLCDDIILWFGLGKYVEKALSLKSQFAPLTPAQKEKAQKLADQKIEEEKEKKRREEEQKAAEEAARKEAQKRQEEEEKARQEQERENARRAAESLKEQKEREEKERLQKEQKEREEKARLQKEQKEREEKERLQKEEEEREAMERLKKAQRQEHARRSVVTSDMNEILAAIHRAKQEDAGLIPESKNQPKPEPEQKILEEKSAKEEPVKDESIKEESIKEELREELRDEDVTQAVISDTEFETGSETEFTEFTPEFEPEISTDMQAEIEPEAVFSEAVEYDSEQFSDTEENVQWQAPDQQQSEEEAEETIQEEPEEYTEPEEEYTEPEEKSEEYTEPEEEPEEYTEPEEEPGEYTEPEEEAEEYTEEPDQYEQPEQAKNSGLPIVNPEDLSRVWHFAIQALPGEDDIELALSYLQELADSSPRAVPQSVVKITGQKLNQKGLVQSLDKLLGKTILIENAAQMNERVINEFCKIIDPTDRSLLVVFIDTPASIRHLLTSYPQLCQAITAQFVRETYSVGELLEYARGYADREDSVLDQSGELALMERLKVIAENQERNKKRIVEMIVNNAIEKAEKKSMRRLFQSKYDKQGCLILRDKDFEVG